jgi:hypothetical protein
MIRRANENGGPDNITVIVARFDGAGLADPAETDDVGHQTFALANDSGQTPVSSPPIGTVTTESMVAARRTTREMPAEAFFVTSTIRDDSLAGRRGRGALIGALLMLVVFGGALWWMYRAAERVIAH